MKASERGSVFVEAALIFPFIILTLALIISFATSIYEKINDQVEYHNTLRQTSMDDGRISSGECDFIRTVDFLAEGI